MPINLPDYADSGDERKLEADYKALRKTVLKDIDPAALDKLLMKKIIPALRDALEKRRSELNLS